MGDESSLTLSEVQRDIAIRHLDQLRQMSLTRTPEEHELPAGTKENEFRVLERWTKENANAISYAVKQRVHGTPDSIDWKCAFLAFMESCALYLRDWNTVVEAAELYTEVAQLNDETKLFESINLLNKSVENIHKLASMWGMKFQLLCDLVDEHSSKHRFWNGPYCGAFYSEDGTTQFIGISFKGTSKIKEWLLNIFGYMPQDSPPDIVYGTRISKGVHNGLFGHFGGSRPFDLITEGLRNLLLTIPKNTSDAVMTHVAGHSLGGSYSSICYTQYTAKGNLPPYATLGDLYTFGCPRNGENDFAIALRDNRPPVGSSWRIVNEGDCVPTVPPAKLVIIPLPWANLVHVDVGYRINPNEAPIRLSSEINTKPAAGNIDKGWDEHGTKSYYPSLQKAMNS